MRLLLVLLSLSGCIFYETRSSSTGTSTSRYGDKRTEQTGYLTSIQTEQPGTDLMIVATQTRECVDSYHAREYTTHHKFQRKSLARTLGFEMTLIGSSAIVAGAYDDTVGFSMMGGSLVLALIIELALPEFRDRDWSEGGHEAADQSDPPYACPGAQPQPLADRDVMYQVRFANGQWYGFRGKTDAQGRVAFPTAMELAARVAAFCGPATVAVLDQPAPPPLTGNEKPATDVLTVQPSGVASFDGMDGKALESAQSCYKGHVATCAAPARERFVEGCEEQCARDNGGDPVLDALFGVRKCRLQMADDERLLKACELEYREKLVKLGTEPGRIDTCAERCATEKASASCK